ncbi:MAG: uracil-DNA glycosylase [Planctomycetota bacterium]
MGPRPQSKGCHGCRHFRVTYDATWPYVCAAFDLRSKRLPSVEVEQASGAPCRAREERATRSTGRRPNGGLYA